MCGGDQFPRFVSFLKKRIRLSVFFMPWWWLAMPPFTPACFSEVSSSIACSFFFSWVRFLMREETNLSPSAHTPLSLAVDVTGARQHASVPREAKGRVHPQLGRSGNCENRVSSCCFLFNFPFPISFSFPFPLPLRYVLRTLLACFLAFVSLSVSVAFPLRFPFVFSRVLLRFRFRRRFRFRFRFHLRLCFRFCFHSVTVSVLFSFPFPFLFPFPFPFLLPPLPKCDGRATFNRNDHVLLFKMSLCRVMQVTNEMRGIKFVPDGKRLLLGWKLGTNKEVSEREKAHALPIRKRVKNKLSKVCFSKAKLVPKFVPCPNIVPLFVQSLSKC